MMARSLEYGSLTWLLGSPGVLDSAETVCFLHSAPSQHCLPQRQVLHRLKHMNTVPVCLASFVLYDQHYSVDELT